MRKQPKWKTRIQDAVSAEIVRDLDTVARARFAARKALASVPRLAP